MRPADKIPLSDKPSALSIPPHPAILNCPTHTSTHASSRQPMKYPYHPTACTHIKWSVLHDALSVKNWHFLLHIDASKCHLHICICTYTYVYHTEYHINRYFLLGAGNNFHIFCGRLESAKKFSLQKISTCINCLDVRSMDTCILAVPRCPPKSAAVCAIKECFQTAQLEEGGKRSAR